ncbi:MAG: hypothetical protein ICV71_01275 [Thermoleophilia bacterium]|jgi:hypothetical protein|nr:hypothetical protein [Thermoleophilia bacterium]
MPGGGGKGKGGISSSVNVNSTADATVDLVGLDNIGVSAELAVSEPIQTKSDVVAQASTRSELAVTQPIVTDMTAAASVDVKPVDVCLTFGIGRLPRARICRPVERRLDVTLLGRELFGLKWSGYSELVFADLAARPHLELGGHASVGRHSPAPRARPKVIGRAPRGAVRLRLGD